jgi:predicted transposase/invertase (TIGR01784 family)
LNDDLGIHFLELKKIEGIKRSPKDAVEAWMMYLNNLEGEAMDEISMDNPGIKKALTIEEAFMRNKQERRIYELREKAIKDELSARLGAEAKGKAEGKTEGIAEGKIMASRDAICQFLEVKFGGAARNTQKQVRQIVELQTLDRVIKNIYTATSLEEAQAIIDHARGNN